MQQQKKKGDLLLPTPTLFTPFPVLSLFFWEERERKRKKLYIWATLCFPSTTKKGDMSSGKKRLVYLGKVLPSTKGELGINDFSPDMIKMLNFDDLPHKFAHLDNITIGKVTKGFTYNDDKYILGYINTDTPIGKYVADNIHEGKDKLSELSLTHRYIYDTSDPKYKYKESKIITEVSSVDRGLRPNCKILASTWITDPSGYILFLALSLSLPCPSFFSSNPKKAWKGRNSFFSPRDLSHFTRTHIFFFKKNH